MPWRHAFTQISQCPLCLYNYNTQHIHAKHIQAIMQTLDEVLNELHNLIMLH